MPSIGRRVIMVIDEGWLFTTIFIKLPFRVLICMLAYYMKVTISYLYYPVLNQEIKIVKLQTIKEQCQARKCGMFSHIEDNRISIKRIAMWCYSEHGLKCEWN